METVTVMAPVSLLNYCNVTLWQDFLLEGVTDFLGGHFGPEKKDLASPLPTDIPPAPFPLPRLLLGNPPLPSLYFFLKPAPPPGHLLERLLPFPRPRTEKSKKYPKRLPSFRQADLTCSNQTAFDCQALPFACKCHSVFAGMRLLSLSVSCAKFERLLFFPFLPQALSLLSLSLYFSFYFSFSLSLSLFLFLSLSLSISVCFARSHKLVLAPVMGPSISPASRKIGVKTFCVQKSEIGEECRQLWA